jgi:hypothetical protein
MSIDHPLPEDSIVTYNPPAKNKPVRRGIITESNTSPWGTMYTLKDAEEGYFIEVGEKAIRGVRRRGGVE